MIFSFKKKNIDAPKILDEIQKEVYVVLKPLGFKKYGRTFHRFVSKDISQIIVFHLGQAYRNETHFLTVHLGIRVPECNEIYSPVKEKKYYHDYECNIRSSLGNIENRDISCYDLTKSLKPIIDDILRQITNIVIPVYNLLDSREKILDNIQNYPEFDILRNPIVKYRENAVIHMHMGDVEKANISYNESIELLIDRVKSDDSAFGMKRAWVINSLEIANKYGFVVTEKNSKWIENFLQNG